MICRIENRGMRVTSLGMNGAISAPAHLSKGLFCSGLVSGPLLWCVGSGMTF